MLTLSRVASAARRLAVLTAVSVREPRPQDSHLCARLSAATSSSVVTPGPVNVHGLAISDGDYHDCVLQGSLGKCSDTG